MHALRHPRRLLLLGCDGEELLLPHLARVLLQLARLLLDLLLDQSSLLALVLDAAVLVQLLPFDALQVSADLLDLVCQLGPAGGEGVILSLRLGQSLLQELEGVFVPLQRALCGGVGCEKVEG